MCIQFKYEFHLVLKLRENTFIGSLVIFFAHNNRDFPFNTMLKRGDTDGIM